MLDVVLKVLFADARAARAEGNMPFYSASTLQVDPPIKLRQETNKDFMVLTGFRYQTPDGRQRFLVHQGVSTDLASIPFFLRWFVQTYGRHTRASILHDTLWRTPELVATGHTTLAEASLDQLERTGPEGGQLSWKPRPRLVTETQANLVFRLALQESTVSVFRRWVMWAAVTLSSRSHRLIAGIGIILFLVAHVAVDLLIAGALLSVNTWHPFGVPLYLAPAWFVVIGFLFWFKQLGAGLIASLVLGVVAIPTLIILIAWGILAAFDYGIVRSVGAIKRWLASGFGVAVVLPSATPPEFPTVVETAEATMDASREVIAPTAIDGTGESEQTAGAAAPAELVGADAVARDMARQMALEPDNG